MATTTKVQIIDADAHVMETDRTWDYLEPSEQKYRPLLYSSPHDPVSQYWMIDGKIGGLRFPTLAEQTVRQMSENSGRTLDTPQESREMDDVELRLQHLDQLGIDIQILHNTLWIEQVTTWPDTQAAMCRAWNRWLADVWKQAKGRLRWSCVVPETMLDEAVVQMRYAKENGAVAVCMKPLEGDRLLTDQYFYPIFEEASRLDMAVVIHIANGNPDNVQLWRTAPGVEGLFSSGFQMFRGPTVILCHVLLMSELPQVFPNLRWAFIEASSQWIPWIYHEVHSRYDTAGREFPQDLFHEKKVYVTCETHDDLPWVLKYAGEHSLVVGTDYGHLDPSSDTDAIQSFRQLESISQETKERILYHNPRALFSL